MLLRFPIITICDRDLSLFAIRVPTCNKARSLRCIVSSCTLLACFPSLSWAANFISGVLRKVETIHTHSGRVDHRANQYARHGFMTALCSALLLHHQWYLLQYQPWFLKLARCHKAFRKINKRPICRDVSECTPLGYTALLGRR